jgi:hypothetical protein
MSDQLENFIRNNRNAFDDKEPPESAWRNIQRSLTRSSSPWFDNLIVWRAAAMIFMALSFYLLIPKFDKENSRAADSEFNDVEAFYTTQISQKVALIEEFSGAESKGEFTRDFQQLEAMYNVLKEEWKSRPSKKVKDAMVLNLLVRINLLNQQLGRLEQDFKEGENTEDKKTI